MSQSSTFGNMRRRLAPFIRPVLEHFPPVRFFAVRLLKLKQKGKLHRCGMEFILPSGDFGVTLEAESTGEYEPVTTNLLQSQLVEGMTFVDVGAHVGLFAVPATEWVGESGSVIAFEPHPDNFKMLCENVKTNCNSSNIEVVQSAVSDVSDPVFLHISAFNTGDHQLFHQGGRRSVEVQCTTLDDYFAPSAKVDVIKMDVQGAESAAFKGMSRVLKENEQIQIIWELSPAQLEDAGSSADELLAWLEEFGFSFTVVDDASGEVAKQSKQEVLDSCPRDSYVNILCTRDA
ncbi:MAG: FkbM family methyltransferase [Phycisphaerae bacterium]|nr:FkbM family methyltransferase [Phycisphaerae bacterium]